MNLCRACAEAFGLLEVLQMLLMEERNCPVGQCRFQQSLLHWVVQSLELQGHAQKIPALPASGGISGNTDVGEGGDAKDMDQSTNVLSV